MLARNQLHSATGPIQSTAGAVPVRNEKGQFSMQKVKVNRYISGKRPGYAPRSSSEEESEDEEFIVPAKLKTEEDESDHEEEPELDLAEAEKNDPRLRRLQNIQTRHRRVEEPEIIGEASDSEEEERPGRHYESDSESGDEALDEDEIERRREYLRQKTLERKDEGELLTKEEEVDSEVEPSDSEYEEEYTDSEEEIRPRLKPVFVRKKERATIKDKELAEEKDNEEDPKKQAETKRRETLKLLEEELRKEKAGKAIVESENSLAQPSDVATDDESPETEYEAWKIRELKRIKRDRDEKETMIREKMELERLHSMTEEERRAELKLRPKVIVNKSSKGKYKFLQKYYHRGVFYLDKEEDVLRRDYSAPTLEDHFDKSVLPKVMQVKNFGRSGRTKYTHLVDQDTTAFDSPWAAENAQSMKFQTANAAGMRPVFEKPSWSSKKRKVDADNE